MSEPPIFTVVQPDGARAEIDLTTPGPFQDFAFTATHTDGRVDYFVAYHVGEPGIFLDVLARMAAGRSADVVLAEVGAIRAHIAASTQGLTCTERSGGFASPWPLTSRQDSRPSTSCYSVGGSPRSPSLTVTANRYGLAFLQRRGRARALRVSIPSTDLWRFAAGMIWRSYRADIPLSRRTSEEYEHALTEFELAISQPSAGDPERGT